MTRLRQAILSPLIILCWAGFAMAEPEVLSAPEAALAQSKGELILVDIRTPEEWSDQGIAAGAYPLDMRDRGFVQNLQALMAEHPGVPLALICATGGRSDFAATRLGEMGLPGLIDIAEGMYGSGAGPGWLARGLPVEPYPR